MEAILTATIFLHLLLTSCIRWPQLSRRIDASETKRGTCAFQGSTSTPRALRSAFEGDHVHPSPTPTDSNAFVLSVIINTPRWLSSRGKCIQIVPQSVCTAGPDVYRQIAQRQGAQLNHTASHLHRVRRTSTLVRLVFSVCISIFTMEEIPDLTPLHDGVLVGPSDDLDGVVGGGVSGMLEGGEGVEGGDGGDESGTGTPGKVIRRKAWTQEEDEGLLQAVLKVTGTAVGAWGASDTPSTTEWSEVVRLVPGRSKKQCRERWDNKVNPGISPDEWTTQEILRVFSFHRKHGNKWRNIASEMPGRTALQCRNIYHSQLAALTKKFPHLFAEIEAGRASNTMLVSAMESIRPEEVEGAEGHATTTSARKKRRVATEGVVADFGLVDGDLHVEGGGGGGSGGVDEGHYGSSAALLPQVEAIMGSHASHLLSGQRASNGAGGGNSSSSSSGGMAFGSMADAAAAYAQMASFSGAPAPQSAPSAWQVAPTVPTTANGGNGSGSGGFGMGGGDAGAPALIPTATSARTESQSAPTATFSTEAAHTATSTGTGTGGSTALSPDALDAAVALLSAFPEAQQQQQQGVAVAGTKRKAREAFGEEAQYSPHLAGAVGPAVAAEEARL